MGHRRWKTKHTLLKKPRMSLVLPSFLVSFCYRWKCLLKKGTDIHCDRIPESIMECTGDQWFFNRPFRCINRAVGCQCPEKIRQLVIRL